MGPDTDFGNCGIQLTLHTDEEQEAIDSLAMVADRLDLVNEDAHQWKWVAISLHNALQGFMVLALRGTWAANAMKPKVRERLYAEAHAGGPALGRPSDRLDDLWGLFDRVQDDQWMSRCVHSKPLAPSAGQKESLRRIADLRNVFAHYEPVTWNMFIADLPRNTLDLMDLIWDLCFVCNTIVFRHSSDNPLPESRRSSEAAVRGLVLHCREKCIHLSEAYLDALPEPKDRSLVDLIAITPRDLP
jgi:hypothetical protein